MEEGPFGLAPVLKVCHELVCREQVAGAIDDGTVRHGSSMSDWLTTGHCHATGVLAAELSRVDGSGAELAVTAFPHSVLHLSLDSLL